VFSIISSSTRALLFEFNIKVRHTFQNHDGRRCKRGSVALLPLHLFSADFETLAGWKVVNEKQNLSRWLFCCDLVFCLCLAKHDWVNSTQLKSS